MTTISQEKREVSYAVFGVGNKNIYFLWSWEKVSLIIQGAFCVPKVYSKGKLHGRFSTTSITSRVSREQRTENTFSMDAIYLFIYFFENIFRIRRTHQR